MVKEISRLGSQRKMVQEIQRNPDTNPSLEVLPGLEMWHKLREKLF